MIKIVTDSSSDITIEEAKELGIIMIPLHINFEDRSYADGVELNAEEFFQKLMSSKKVPTTSQVSPGEYEDIFADAKKNGDTLFVMPLSSALSGSHNTAVMVKNQGEYDNVTIFQTYATVNALRLLVIEANKQKDKMTVEQLHTHMENFRKRLRLYACIDTLEYLHKGGRVSKASAMIGGMLNMKPLIIVNPAGEVQNVGKQIGSNKAVNWIAEQVKNNPIDTNYPLFYQYSVTKDAANRLIDLTSPNPEDSKANSLRSLGPVVGTHVGPGAAAIIYVVKEGVEDKLFMPKTDK